MASNKEAKATRSGEEFGFEAEVARLLKLMVHSVYSEKEIFLRELISNASDACDRLRHAALTQPELTAGDADFRIEITLDPTAKTITVSDNGIGMNKADLIENLGTIARSGTARFMESLAASGGEAALELIGQFGVGFYSVFMVADHVEVASLKAGEDAAWRWTSDGEGGYRIAPAEKERRGTDVVLHIKGSEAEYLEKPRLAAIVRRYSDHIAVPITLAVGDGKAEAVNTGTALWARPKPEITEQQYAEFYRHVSGAFDNPLFTLHFHAEGRIDYRALLFIPETPPFDLFDPARKSRVKLYVKRVFITDDCEELIPGYLRFLKGVVDSQDLPLNISREMLQNNPVVALMRKAIVGRLLSDLAKLAEKDAATYLDLWDKFGRVIKEGLYEDAERRDELLGLARFHTTKAEGWTTLADYVGRMSDKQEAIYFIRGDERGVLEKSPQLEGFRARDIEVLLLTDPIDDFWVDVVGEYDGKPFRSLTRGATDLKAFAKDKAEGDADDPKVATLIAVMKTALEKKVADIRTTDRLTDSPVCLVAAEGGLDLHLERILREHDRLPTRQLAVLEVNPGHALIKALARRVGEEGAAEQLEEAAHLLFDQARIVEGEPLADAADFARRMTALLERAYA